MQCWATSDLLMVRGDVDVDVLLAGPLDEDDLGGGDDLAALEAQPHARHAGAAQDEGARDHGAGLNTPDNIISTIQPLSSK